MAEYMILVIDNVCGRPIVFRFIENSTKIERDRRLYIPTSTIQVTVRYMVQLGPNADKMIGAIVKSGKMDETEARKYLEGLQEIIDEMATLGQYQQYIKERKLKLLNSSYDTVDELLEYGVLRG